GPVEGGPAPRGRRDSARSGGPHDRLRPPVRDLQAGRPDLPRSRPPAAAAGEPLAPGADRVLRQGASRRRAGQAGPPARVRAYPGGPVRRPDRVYRGLRHAPGPQSGAGGGPLAQRAAGARFTAQRMVREYFTEYYLPAMRGEMPADDPPTA